MKEAKEIQKGKQEKEKQEQEKKEARVKAAAGAKKGKEKEKAAKQEVEAKGAQIAMFRSVLLTAVSTAGTASSNVLGLHLVECSNI